MEDFVLLLFLASVAGVYLLAALAVARGILRRFGRLAAPAGYQLRLHRIVIALAVVGVLCMAYGYFIEPYWLSVTRVRVASAKLPPGTRPIRLVHISDLHSDPQARLEEQLPDAIAAERPDLIVFTGDSINSPAGLPVLRNCLTRLARIAPTFVVKGNWDASFWRAENLFAGTGVRELKNEAVRFDAGGVSLWIAGVPVGGEHRLDETLDALPPEAFKVFLYHYPDLINEVAAKKIDLYCAGHTHGGQVALPLYGALVTLSKFGKRYEAGLYRVGETTLYVNRGMGMEGGAAPRVRFWARPEVTVIEIAPR
ncbi:MAG TPA: metallophosphoesterase [Pyrinomonadaceae bacterium]|nr:metallophosphoesterase [Pyrinomonadaceae bacterium]